MRGTWWIVFVFAAGAAIGARFSERSDAAPSAINFAAAAEREAKPEPSARRHIRDLDCRDFASHSEAQAFFEDNNPEEDPHRLDGDGDGEAREDVR